MSLEVDKQTKSTITTPQNDYPLGDGTAYRLSSVGPALITGFADGVNGRLAIIDNVGPAAILIPHDDAGSLALNRVLAIDGEGVVIYPGMAAWLQYDGTSQRWRELANVPFVRQKGDLLTATDSGPSVLRSSGNDGDVLTVRNSEDEGIDWEPPPGARDWFGRISGGIGVPGYEHWQVGGHAVGCLIANVDVAGGVLYALPIVCPRGGTVLKIAVVVDLPAATPDQVAYLGIYGSAAADTMKPSGLLAAPGFVDISTSGRQELTLTPALDVPAGSVIWLALWSSASWNGRCMTGTVAPSFGPWPVLAFDAPESLCPGCGWAQGDGMMVNPDYSTGLPDPFGSTSPPVAITPLKVDDTRNLPAIFILWA